MEKVFKHNEPVDSKVFDYIKTWVINFYKLTESNEFGYVDEKISEIKKVVNDNDYSAMFILNSLHVLSKRHIINVSTPMSVIDYVTKHSDDLNDMIKYHDDPKLTKNFKRYRKIQKVLKNDI